MAPLGRLAARPVPADRSVELVEVLAHGVVAFPYGVVRVGDEAVNDRVGEDLFVHPVVPLSRRQLGAVDRRGVLMPSVDQGVQVLDLLAGRWGEEPSSMMSSSTLTSVSR